MLPLGATESRLRLHAHWIRPGVDALQTLRKYTRSIDDQRWEELIDLIACGWIDLCTARHFSRFKPGDQSWF